MSEQPSSAQFGDQAFGSDPLQRVTLGYLINLLARLLAQSLKARNGVDGILPGQFPIVLELLKADGPTQRDLCEFVKIEQSTMANTLKRMERDGIIERRACADDGRQATVHLTEHGRTLAQAAVINAFEVNRVALEPLDKDAQVQLRAGLIAMVERLEADIARQR
ncbi:MarR family winged helix-turn-helix transcriptional regulator [Azorhizobium doebereinerae]|uniref:MarR family winged helix-turn-helix transcriptional regulator n=1 Tax=Azorhizobium doebereinerae TaxID=281091 RepID=UPI0003F9BCB4|nr:MarR family winged helix-turn-helix transcriptional regulator [Azorhizobium doebereinerae]